MIGSMEEGIICCKKTLLKKASNQTSLAPLWGAIIRIYAVIRLRE